MQKQEEKKQIQETQPGLRFYPTEEELVSFYLNKKLENQTSDELNKVIPAINIYAFQPWQLPKLSGELCNGDTEQWFFFVPRQEREALGGRPSRTTTSGYWKATGSPSYVYSSDNRVIGVKKSLVFYQGKAPTGTKTKWKMHEYRAIKREMTCPSSSHLAIPKLRHEVSLCRVYVISGSFRAFDRRPLATGTSKGKVTDEAARHGNNCPQFCSQSATTMGGRNSAETSALTNEIAKEVSSSSFDNVDNEGGRIWGMDGTDLRSFFEW